MPDPLAETFHRFPATCPEVNSLSRRLLEKVDALASRAEHLPAFARDGLRDLRADLCALATREEQVRTSMRAAWAAHVSELSAPPVFIPLRDRCYDGTSGPLVGFVRAADVVGVCHDPDSSDYDSLVLLRGGGTIQVRGDVESTLSQITGPTP